MVQNKGLKMKAFFFQGPSIDGARTLLVGIDFFFHVFNLFLAGVKGGPQEVK